MIHLFTAILNILNNLWRDNKTLSQQIQSMEQKIMALADKVTALEQAQARIDQDVTNVQTLVAGLKTNVADLTQLVAELQANGTTPELEARLQAIADDLNAKDEQLDALAPDAQTV